MSDTGQHPYVEITERLLEALDDLESAAASLRKIPERFLLGYQYHALSNLLRGVEGLVDGVDEAVWAFDPPVVDCGHSEHAWAGDQIRGLRVWVEPKTVANLPRWENCPPSEEDV